MKILVVDDDAVVGETCNRVLTAEGYAVCTAVDASAGVAALERQTFDLLITDVKMPGQDGFELIRQAHAKQPQLAVLVSTGYLTGDTVARGEGAGAHGFIAKPFTPDELLVAVQDTLRQAAATGHTP